jgi:predicted  nucleic acid-binding Zn-ribbon protein
MTMQDITWVGVVGVLLLVAQLVNLFNSTAIAKKNINAPLDIIRADVATNKEDIGAMKHEIKDLKRDVDHAHAKIRETEDKLARTTKAQNKAFMALLFWAKSGGEDASKIDEAINEISEL